MCFDCGEQAAGLRHDDVPSAAHGHADCLSVVVGLGGREVLVDPGFFCYNGDPAWEVHFRKTAAHNTVVVDGRDQAQHVSKMAWTRTYPNRVCHGDYRLGNMLCDGADVAALIDWEIWSLSDPRLDLAWFLFFTEEAKHPMASNPGPTGMPTADALYAAYVDGFGSEPANMEWFHCLIRYKEAAATALLMKRAVKSGAADAGGSWVTAIPALTVECIERLQKFEPSR